MRWRLVLIALVAVAVLPGRAAQRPIGSTGFSTTDLFTMSKVWAVHLAFSREEWNAMQPRQTGSFGSWGFNGGLQGPEGARNGVAARQGIEFDYVHADATFETTTFHDVAVRFKGNGTFMRGRASGKISLKVDLNKYVKGQKLAGVSTINLENNITDAGWMNEELAYRLYRDAGVPAPRTAYARVFITVPGLYTHEYFGLYSISENVDTNFIQERFGTKLGAILKPSTSAPFTDLGPTWETYNQAYDPKTDLTDAEKARIILMCRFFSSASDADVAAHVGDYVDLDEFARYFAVLAWLANPDSLLSIGQNYYVYIPAATGKLTFIPWDQDWSFGSSGGRSGNSVGWTVDYPWSGNNLFLGRVYGVPAFRDAYLRYLEEFGTTIFRAERFHAQMAEIGPAIRPAIQEESATYVPYFDAVVAGQAGIEPFAKARASAVQAQLEALKTKQ